MRSHHSQNLSYYFVSSAISCALVISLCVPFTSSVKARREGSTKAKSSASANAPAAQTWVVPFEVAAFGNGLEAKMYGGMNYVNTLKASSNKSFRYGLDRDNVPFAQKTDGTTGRFIHLSPNHFKLKITRGRRLGEVEFTRLSSFETLTRFKTGGGSFLVRTTTETRDNGATKTNVGFQYKNIRAALKIDEERAERGFTPDAEKELRAMVTSLRKNRELKQLMEDARSFSDKSVLFC